MSNRTSTPVSTDVLEHRVTVLENAVCEMRDAVKGIDNSLKLLTQLETRHTETRDALARAFKSIDAAQARADALAAQVQTLQQEMPVIRLVNKYLITGVVALVGMVGVAILKPLLG